MIGIFSQLEKLARHEEMLTNEEREWKKVLEQTAVNLGIQADTYYTAIEKLWVRMDIAGREWPVVKF